MADLDKLQAELDEASKAEEQAGQRREEAQNALADARVEAMDSEVVNEAQELGINPRNFENETQLKEAIEMRKNEEGEQNND